MSRHRFEDDIERAGREKCFLFKYNYIIKGHKLRAAQRAMERKMLNLKIKDKVPYTEIRKRTRVHDIVQFVLK